MSFPFFRKKKQIQTTKSKPEIDKVDLQLSSDIEKNAETIKKALGNSDDVFIRDLDIHHKKAKLIYLYSLADNMMIQSVLDDLLNSNYPIEESKHFTLEKIDSTKEPKKIITNLLVGFVLLLFEGEKDPYCFIALRSDGRQVESPTTENIVRGSHEAYVESSQTTLLLLRKGVV